MLHKFINILHRQFNQNQWMFILTCYELAKSGWIKRQDVYDAMAISPKSSHVSPLINSLIKKGMVEQRRDVMESNQGFCYVRLTKEARDILVGAFKAIKA